MSLPYIILLGDVGSGKSTLVEKITGVTNRSSNASTSFTKTADAIRSRDGSLVICDTPGSNAMENRFESNLQIAHAMNFMPVSSIMIVFKADTRIDNVIESITGYLERFLPEDFPLELLGVCVTHMDQVNWQTSEFVRVAQGELGTDTVVFSSANSSGDYLCQEMKSRINMSRTKKLDVNSEVFLKLFKIADKNLKVLRGVRKEVAKFEKMRQDFYQQRDSGSYSEDDKRNMTFEFQAWMLQEIIEAQKRLSAENMFKFDLNAPQTASEAGHVANMTNQLRTTLADVRIDAMKYHKDVDSNFRACPHCAVVWTKIEGCDGTTQCGTRPGNASDDWSFEPSGVMSTFHFVWNAATESLQIQKSERRSASKSGARSEKAGKSQDVQAPSWLTVIVKKLPGGGCGKDIAWQNMSPVKMPVEFDVNPASTKDVPMVSQDVQAQSWGTVYENRMKKLSGMKISSA